MSLQRGNMRIPAAGDVLDYLRLLGWRRSLLRGAYVAANQPVALSIFDCFRLRREDINMALAKATGGYECRFLAPDEANRFACQLDGATTRIIPEVLARGDAVYVVLDGELLANIGFYAEGPTPILNDLVVHFDPPPRYMYRGYTQVAYRGRRLHALGILRAAMEIFDHQVPQLVTICERTNYPATISVLRMGWKPCGTLYRVGVGPWSWLGRTAAARGMGMLLQPRQLETSV
jgi:hypothetical protein